MYSLIFLSILDKHDKGKCGSLHLSDGIIDDHLHRPFHNSLYDLNKKNSKE